MEPEIMPEDRPVTDKPVTAIIPAYNEERTITGVIRAIEHHPLIGEIIVVDDGSSDKTAEAAKTTSARVIRNKKNTGKAGAMARGVREAKTPIVLFVDADMKGLTHQALTRIVQPVVDGRYDMHVGISSRDSKLIDSFMTVAPLIAGQRAMRKEWWYEVPPAYRRNFQIELALNYFIKKKGGRIGFEIIPGLKQVTKEKKRGLLRGLIQRIDMIDDLIQVIFDLYLIRDIITKRL